ncbi:T9SS type A sorting domain-containing protein [Riemerella anatipestifer]
MKKLLLSGLVLSHIVVLSQNVNIPDSEFKQALIKHYPKIDTNGDGEISVTEAEALTDRLDLSDKKINNLTGLEAFKNVEEIQLYYNTGSLTEIDFSGNKALKRVYLEGSNISSINISQNTELEDLNSYYNNLTSLDVSQNTKLKILNFGDNQISNIDLSKNPELITLDGYNNQLTSLNIDNNTKLTSLSCYGNSLTNISIDKNPKLVSVDLSNNKIETLDASKNPDLVNLSLASNNLNSLNIAFGSYANFSGLDITNNPNLTCVKITEGEKVSSTWQQDSGVTYNTDCGTMSTSNLSSSSDDVTLYPNPVKDILYITSKKTVSEINLYDASGTLILSNTHGKTIDLNHLKKGVYLLSIKVDGKMITKKIIKQ